MIDRRAKDSFWAVVSDCLVEVDGLPRAKAETRSNELRKRVERPSRDDSADIFYHAEPFDVAQDIAGEERDHSKYRTQYEEILARHNW